MSEEITSDFGQGYGSDLDWQLWLEQAVDGHAEAHAWPAHVAERAGELSLAATDGEVTADVAAGQSLPGAVLTATSVALKYS